MICYDRLHWVLPLIPNLPSYITPLPLARVLFLCHQVQVPLSCPDLSCKTTKVIRRAILLHRLPPVTPSPTTRNKISSLLID
jgi:hypothetical protein